MLFRHHTQTGAIKDMCGECYKYAVKCAECGIERPKPKTALIKRRIEYWREKLIVAQSELEFALRHDYERSAAARLKYFALEKDITDALVYLGMCLPPKPIEDRGDYIVYI